MALLLHNQAQFVQVQTQFVAEIAKLDREHNELKKQADSRFARIEALLLEHERLLRALPDVLKEKIGFKT